MMSRKGRKPLVGGYALLVIVVLAGACTTDDVNPVGEDLLENGRLGTLPDTASVLVFNVAGGDTTFPVPTPLGNRAGLLFGRSQDTRFHVAMRFRLDGFRIGADTLIDEAELRFDLSDFPDRDLSFDYTIVELADSLEEDSLLFRLPATRGTAVSTGIPGDTLRTLFYEAPPANRRVASLDTAIVRQWLQGLRSHPGILLRVEGDPAGVFGIAARNFAETNDIARPLLRVHGTSGGRVVIDTTFTVEMDLAIPVNQPATQGLSLTDGFVQRVWVPVPLDSIDDRVHLHAAFLTLSIDTSRTFGDALRVRVYAPDSDDLSSDAALDGIGVLEEIIDLDAVRSGDAPPVVKFSVRNILQFFRDGDLPNFGLAIRIDPEGGSPNMVEFVSSRQSPIEGPRYEIVFSRPARFAP